MTKHDNDCRGKAVLIINDEPSVLEVTSQVLRHEGYETVTAVNGADALSLYKKNKDIVCIVLLDLLMPVMDGEKTIKAIRQINPNVKIVVTTGVIEEKYYENLSEKEVQAVLTKPYKIEQLVNAIHKALET